MLEYSQMSWHMLPRCKNQQMIWQCCPQVSRLSGWLLLLLCLVCLTLDRSQKVLGTEPLHRCHKADSAAEVFRINLCPHAHAAWLYAGPYSTAAFSVTITVLSGRHTSTRMWYHNAHISSKGTLMHRVPCFYLGAIASCH